MLPLSYNRSVKLNSRDGYWKVTFPLDVKKQAEREFYYLVNLHLGNILNPYANISPFLELQKPENISLMSLINTRVYSVPLTEIKILPFEGGTTI